MLLKNYRRLLRRAINHALRARYRTLASVRTRVFSGHGDPLGQPPPSRRTYSNLYQRELKDYVINALKYRVGYDRFDVSIRLVPRRGNDRLRNAFALNTSDRMILCNYPALTLGMNSILYQIYL